jgi:hypothetical protein
LHYSPRTKFKTIAKTLTLSCAIILTACGGGGESTSTGNAAATNTASPTTNVTVKFPFLFDQGGAKVLPTYISHIITSEKRPLASVQIENTGEQATFQISADLPIYGNQSTQTVTLAAGEKKTISISPVVNYAQLFQNTTNLPASLGISITSSGKNIFQQNYPIQITGRNTVFWSNGSESIEPLIATMVTPQDKNQSIQGLLRSAASRFAGGSTGMVGYQQTSWPEGSYSIQPGQRTQQESFYVLPGESPSVTIKNVSTLFDSSSDLSVYIMDDANFTKWTSGQAANVCSKNEAAVAGVTIACAPQTSAGYYHIVYFNQSGNILSRTVTRSRPMTKWEVTYYQSQAIFEELRARGLTYINLTGSGFFSSSQNVRYPSESLAGQGANCIDGSLLFASALEALGMEPVIAISQTAGHAFVAARCWVGSTDCVVPIETTMIGGSSSFGEAHGAAIGNWNKWLSDSSLKALDIKALRAAGITPAPM